MLNDLFCSLMPVVPPAERSDKRHRSSGLHGKDNKVYEINQTIVQISLHGDGFFNISHPK